MVSKITTTKDLRKKLVFNLLVLLVFGLIFIMNSLNTKIDLEFIYNNLLFISLIMYSLAAITMGLLKIRIMSNGLYVDVEFDEKKKEIRLKNNSKIYSFKDIKAYIRDEKRGVTGFLVSNKVYVYTDEQLICGKEKMSTIFSKDTLGYNPFKEKFIFNSWITIMYIVIFLGLFIYIGVAGLALRTFFTNNLYIPYAIIASLFLTMYISMLLRLRLFKKYTKEKLE